eukprot:TRINITY_DN6675_c0_g2_i3.p1 TRINITY_DN6675_c0_g2~~TRINITY_DN6675_c0_g2_i3.p1  ORF type:complete len:317 (+),score=95.79 TRINITY_DN6675_c0_g2_i3:144-953(+)
MKSKWTEEEDKIVIEAVRRFGEKNWQQVANALEGRTGQQCLHRWQKTLNPNIHRGRWSADEDMKLTLAVKAYGSKNWIKIQKHVPGRTDVQCRERWVNILNPQLNNGPWTDEEDVRLKDAIEKFGIGKWSQIANALHPRTDNQCWRRWKSLNVEQVDDYRRTIYKKRKGLVNNFVGREKERPNLTPDDFEIEDERARKRRRMEEDGEENVDEEEEDAEGEGEGEGGEASIVHVDNNQHEILLREKEEPIDETTIMDEDGTEDEKMEEDA